MRQSRAPSSRRFPSLPLLGHPSSSQADSGSACDGRIQAPATLRGTQSPPHVHCHHWFRRLRSTPEEHSGRLRGSEGRRKKGCGAPKRKLRRPLLPWGRKLPTPVRAGRSEGRDLSLHSGFLSIHKEVGGGFPAGAQARLL